MTAIACWIQNEHNVPFTWAIGDTRVSQPSSESTSVLHDHAPKIFSIPLAIRKPSKDTGAFSEMYFISSFGFAYSGASQTGLSLVASLHTIFSQLGGHGGAPTPTQIADYIAYLLTDYFKAYGWTVGRRAFCECAVLGFCPYSSKPQIVHLTPRLDSVKGIIVECSEFLVNQEGDFLLLGSHGVEIRTLIEEERRRHSHGSLRWWRASWTVIQQCIDQQRFPDIGGHIQLGFGTFQGFDLAWVAEPGPDGQSKMNFLGLPTFDQSRTIGPCFPSMRGMAFMA